MKESAIKIVDAHTYTTNASGRALYTPFYGWSELTDAELGEVIAGCDDWSELIDCCPGCDEELFKRAGIDPDTVSADDWEQTMLRAAGKLGIEIL